MPQRMVKFFVRLVVVESPALVTTSVLASLSTQHFDSTSMWMSPLPGVLLVHFWSSRKVVPRFSLFS